MISTEKQAQALYAINGVLIQLRLWALRNEDSRKSANVLDIAEQLPRFLASGADQTTDFEDTLRDLADLYPEFRLALDRFLQDSAPNRW